MRFSFQNLQALLLFSCFYSQSIVQARYITNGLELANAPHQGRGLIDILGLERKRSEKISQDDIPDSYSHSILPRLELEIPPIKPEDPAAPPAEEPPVTPIGAGDPAPQAQPAPAPAVQHIGEDPDPPPAPTEKVPDPTVKPTETPPPKASPDPPPAPTAQPLSPDDLRNRGNAVVSGLDRAIDQKIPDNTNVPDMSQGYNAYPNIGVVLSDQTNANIRVPLQALRKPDQGTIDIGAKGKGYEVESKTAPSRPAGQWRSRAAFGESASFLSEGLFIVKQLFAANDGAAAANKLKASDLLFQEWKKSTTVGKTSNVNKMDFIVHQQVINKDACSAIDKAIQDNHIPDGQPGEWLPGSDEYIAILGTDNGRVSAYMLTDHHTELGDKKVAKIITWKPSPTGPNGTPSSLTSYTIIFVLG